MCWSWLLVVVIREITICFHRSVDCCLCSSMCRKADRWPKQSAAAAPPCYDPNRLERSGSLLIFNTAGKYLCLYVTKLRCAITFEVFTKPTRFFLNLWPYSTGQVCWWSYWVDNFLQKNFLKFGYFFEFFPVAKNQTIIIWTPVFNAGTLRPPLPCTVCDVW